MKNRATITFISTAIFASLVLWLSFELRYVWYITLSDLIFIRSIFAVFLLAIWICWIFRPSKVVTAMLGIVALIFPPMISNSYVSVDFVFLFFIFVAVLCLVFVAHVRVQSRMH